MNYARDVGTMCLGDVREFGVGPCRVPGVLIAHGW
jgi:hypothetical protein